MRLTRKETCVDTAWVAAAVFSCGAVVGSSAIIGL